MTANQRGQCDHSLQTSGSNNSHVTLVKVHSALENPIHALLKMAIYNNTLEQIVIP